MAEVSGSSTYLTEDKSARIDDENGHASMTKPTTTIGPEMSFGWNRFSLRPIGLWPEKAGVKNQRNLMMRCGPPIWSLWVFTFVVVPPALAPIAYTFVLRELIELINAAAGCVGAIVRIMVLWYNSEGMAVIGKLKSLSNTRTPSIPPKVLANCLSFLSDDWSRQFSTEERETIMRNAKLGKNISIGVTIFVQCIVWSYVVLRALPLLHMKLDDYNATELGKQLFYPGYCPFDLSNQPNFGIVWGGQCVGLLFVGFAYAGADGFFAVLIIHVCAQFTILRCALIKLGDDGTFRMSTEKFRSKLRILMKRHHTLINLANAIKESVSFLLLVLILIGTLQLCCQLFCLMTAVTEHKPGHFPLLQVFCNLSFLISTFMHLFVYCYVGDMLIHESEALAWASYSSKWYNLSSSSANDLKFVMCRARIPLQIRAGKFAPYSLELFGGILKTSMSYFSVLLTMRERLVE